MVWPGIALLFTTLAFNLLGDGLRDAFDPRLALDASICHGATRCLVSPPNKLLPLGLEPRMNDREPELGAGRHVRKGVAMNKRFWLALVACGDRRACSSRGDCRACGKLGGGKPKARAERSSSSIDTDVDYIDPQLSYYGERGSSRRDALQALQLARQGRRRRRRRHPEVAAGLPVISKDGKTYTFTIKPGFKFSNGKAVNAKSFGDAFKRFAEPEDAVAGLAVPRHRQGAQASSTARRRVSGVKANGNKLASS